MSFWFALISTIFAYAFFPLEMTVLKGIEILAVFFNFWCVYAAANEDKRTWVYGTIGVIGLGYVFFNAGLFGSMVLSLFFFLPMQIYGFYLWNKGVEIQNFTDSWNWKQIATILASVAFAIFLAVLTQTPTLDLAILIFSVIGQVLMAQKKTECWYMWMLVNLISIPTYYIAGLPSLAVQYGLFLTNSIYGFYLWRKIAKH